ncbi:hypothetical protein GGS26DRAFT_569184 [Hypomontagnella submonticulosa]|nr:hypothetical protein GGS26DRAFT_569184 [Hypomontagnella submonticulosa]
MLTRAVCQPTSRTGSLQTRTMACNAVRPTGTSLLRTSHYQQTRSFRFGMWSSYLDPEFQRELRHRHRVLKHKYSEALNRKLLWDQGSLNGHPKAVIKHMLRRYWNPAHARYGLRFVNHDELNGRQQQSRATADTQDWYTMSSRGWMGRRCNYNTSPPNYTWKSRLDEAMDRWTAQNPKDTAGAESTLHSAKSTVANAESNTKHENVVDDYTIDPITNRKVLRGTDGLIDGTEPSAAGSFKSYRAQFAAFAPPKDGETTEPIHSDGPPPPAELKEYGRIKIDHDELLSPGEDAESRYPVIQSEEYALNHLPPEEPDEQHDDLDRYEAYQRGELQDQALEPTEKYEDLDKYKTYGAREAENLDTEVTQDRDDLHEYKPYMHKENANAEKQAERYDDLGDYGPYKYQEDVKRDESPEKYDDLDKYNHYDDNGKPVDDVVPKYKDLNKYKSTDFQDSQAEEQPFQQYGDLEKYRAFKHQELNNQESSERDIVSESLQEFDAKEQDPNSADSLKFGVADSLRNMDLNDYPIAEYPDSTPQMTSSREVYGHSPMKSESREALERSIANHNEASDAADREASSNVKKSRMNFQESQRKLTGNYVRDFPEEFSGSWDRASRFNPESAAQLEPEIPAKLEPSLDRQQFEPKLESTTNQEDARSTRGMFDHHFRAQAEVDPYSKEPQGLETSYTKECDAQQTPPTFVKTYGGESKEEVLESPSKDASQGIFQLKSLYFRDPEIDGRPLIPSSASDSKVEPTPITEPTVYKVLAYDPAMQKINIAETTSVVPDQASPLTPAEVLLRLSNPTKFFPHFAPLQAEGFEIVSGSGDVLVFRQVRPSKTTIKDTEVPINPIDMMGKPTALPSAAAFVSPTGFINYDVPQVEEETQAPPFRSNIDVRREEPVFSGPKSAASEDTHKAREKSLGKRALVGGAWVAGISYALGVVSEYFMTGGADGRGPTGF